MVSKESSNLCELRKIQNSDWKIDRSYFTADAKRYPAEKWLGFYLNPVCFFSRMPP
jgi:hypothetical protein